VRRARRLALLASAGLAFAACSNPPLEKAPAPVIALDNELEIEGQFCATPPADAVFPVKIVFLMDCSGSLIVTDPADIRVQAVSTAIQKYQGLPGVEFAVIGYSSSIVDLTNGFTSTPDLGTITQYISQADNLTDDQGALAAVYTLLSTDILSSTPAERARTRYIINYFTDGTPDPQCSPIQSPCAPTAAQGPVTCPGGQLCTPTTILNASGQQVENYACTPQYLVCTVPKSDWGTAFNPPVDPSLYPGLQAGAPYNTTPQLLASVAEIMQLQTDYHVASIELNTNFLFPIDALSNPLAGPFDLDRPAGEALLQAMATEGDGTFQEFLADTQINFLNIDYSAIQVPNLLVASFPSNQMAIESGGALLADSDGDGLPDAEETSLGTCAAKSVKCTTPADSDGDGYSDYIEVKYKANGFDPLDPNKPATPCVPKGLDTDGDGLFDCEESYLTTDPTTADSDGDFVSDLTEERNTMNPLDPTDAHGDINRDGILNGDEIAIGLSPFAQVSPAERGYAFTSAWSPEASSFDAGGACFHFDVQHLRLVTTGDNAVAPQGGNRVYFDVYQSEEDSPATLSTVRRACADVLYVDGGVKLPLNGVVNFADQDFVDLQTFNPAKNCKDMTQGFDAGVTGGGPSDAGGKG
jgi:hypothetical protein